MRGTLYRSRRIVSENMFRGLSRGRTSRRRAFAFCLTATTASVCMKSRFSHEQPRVVAYVTDVEGCYEFWNRYVERSQVLTRNASTGRLELADGAHFVFGGDAVDQGPGDLAFLRELLQLSSDYPHRVHIILGNRDVNKMRLPRELSPNSHTDTFHRGAVRVPFCSFPFNIMIMTTAFSLPTNHEPIGSTGDEENRRKSRRKITV